MFLFLFILTVAVSAGFQGWRTLFNNFAVDEIGLNGFLVGATQSFREVPGFLAFTVIFVLFLMREERLIVYATGLMGLGVLLTGFFPSFTGLMATTFIMSVGFHYFETANQSLSLQHFSKKESPHVLANLKSVTAITNILVGGLIFLLAKVSDFMTSYVVLGAIVILGAIWAYIKTPKQENAVVQQKKIILKKKYWLFYMLNFLSGARRQIFVVFSVLLLVEKYEFSVVYITALFVLNNLVSIFTNPLIAKMINRFGERITLSFEYVSLALIFLAYAYVESPWVAAGLYVLDHVFFNFSIGIKTYFQKHAEEWDIAPSMAVGFTINHIAAVVLPVLGGYLWLLDWRIPFVGAAVLSVVSLVFAQFMKPDPVLVTNPEKAEAV
ncbi:MFS transporter (plasmid) [Fulvitalea axinellae]|uniref:MFS transporter n=1 Tax=Fulvitalea axinellae TaxID=1182444 RepID=A0AAU9CU90_9BACT|nr:MFS transporter [Fulvitalea axinellae]